MIVNNKYKLNSCDYRSMIVRQLADLQIHLLIGYQITNMCLRIQNVQYTQNADV